MHARVHVRVHVHMHVHMHVHALMEACVRARGRSLVAGLQFAKGTRALQRACGL